MNKPDRSHRFVRPLLESMLLLLLVQTQAHALSSFSVVDAEGEAVSDYRWLLEEDTTHSGTVGVVDAQSVGVSVHKSHAPVVASGTSADLSALFGAVDPAKRYYVSVLPGLPGGSVTVGDFSISGAPVAPGQASASVHVHANPLPSARMAVYAFHDNRAINSAPDVGTEQGLAGFEVKLYDTLLGEQAFFDFCGNPLGTTYSGGTCDDVASLGNGTIQTGPDGEVFVRNLYPGKYAVEVVPTTKCPDGSDWIQTSTIEGTPEVDVWLEPGGPEHLLEFGYLVWHAFFGFVCKMDFPPPGPGVATATITGVASQRHLTKAPVFSIVPGIPIPEAIVGLNDLRANDQQVYTGFADPETGVFTIPNVPPGLYQLVVWDRFLDSVIGFRTVAVGSDAADVDVGHVASTMWFHRLQGFVFHDANENGFRDASEAGLPAQGLGLRFRDGSIYQVAESLLTPTPGAYAFDEIFPFLKYLILEINFDRFKATGASFQLDEGGLVGDPPGIERNPQTPPAGEACAGDASFRCEPGLVLLEAHTTSMAGASNRADFGKKPYVVGLDGLFGTPDDIPGENGGIAGIFYYASTRAEFDPRFAAGDDWEPGVPRAQVVLYQDTNDDGAVDDTNGVAGIQYADVDNHPVGWSEGGDQGPEDVERDGAPGFGLGDALEIAHTDSFDDKVPDMAPCPGPAQSWQGTPLLECAETLRTGSQIRPQVFDGGYAFLPPPGRYIVEAIAPPGYEHVKDGDLNVTLGDSYIPGALPAECVGDDYVVPATLTLDGVTDNPSPMAGTPQKTCNRKKVRLAEAENQALIDFFLFTAVPKAGRIIGLVTDDVQGETDPTHPRFTDKRGVPWIPVSIQDFADHEINRTHTDEFGEFEALAPSTWTASVPSPSGFAPHMVKIVLNPATFPDGTPDPTHNASYMTVSYVRDVMPAKTSYLDIPTLPRSPRSALQGVDCADAVGTPRIAAVDGPGGGPVVAPGDALTIHSLGITTVPNPAYPLDCASTPGCDIEPTIERDYGFGTAKGAVSFGATGLTITNWGDAAIDGIVPPTTPPGAYQLTVVSATGKHSAVGITVHVVGPGYDPPIVRVGPGGDIQAAIDGAVVGSLILVAPGEYRQNLLVWKRVRLQGHGAGTTILDGSGFGPTEQQAWAAQLESRIASGDVDLVPGQNPQLELVQGAVVAWFGTSPATPAPPPSNPLLDGFTVRGGTRGGGVHVNGYVANLEISNDAIERNQGNFGGGIRLGTPTLPDGTGLGWLSSQNPDVHVHNDAVTGNGGVSGGGGIALFNGSDRYRIRRSLVCGNFTLIYGAGIQHFGLSPGGLIEENEIRFNQAFDEGGGLFVGGELVPAGAPPATLSQGSGSVTVNRNRLLGNLGFDDGGGIRTLDVNGQDVAASSNPADWYAFRVTNNMIVNNVSNDSGGGLSIDDTVRAQILHNTIAYNQTTATNEDNFGLFEGGPVFGDPFEPGELGISTPLPAGLATRILDAGLQAVLPPGSPTFSQPLLYDNVIIGNRASYFDGSQQAVGFLIAADGPDSDFSPPAGQPDFFNLGVYGGTGAELLQPAYSALMDLDSANGTTFSATNVLVPVDFSSADPDAVFIASRLDPLAVGLGGRAGPLFTVEVTVSTPGAVDHHLTQAGADLLDVGTNAIPGGPYGELAVDYDGHGRVTPIHLGADQRLKSGCGLGIELAPILAALLALRRRTRKEAP